MTGIEPRPQRWEARVLPLCHRGPHQQVMDNFTHMISILSSFIEEKQETTTCIAFCNYLTSEVEGSEEKDFQQFEKGGYKASQEHSKQGRRMQSSAPAATTDTFMKLKSNFNICATNFTTVPQVSTVTAAS